MKRDRLYLIHIRDAIRKILDYTAEGREASLFGSTSQAGHVGFGPGFIEEHEFGHLEVVLCRLPRLASPLHVGSILLTRS